MKVNSYVQIENFAQALKHFLLAVSWGGHESLIMPKCAGIASEDFEATNEEHRLVRIYIGLEETNYLIEDLDQALSII
ncbi:MAG: PLP-dependent transferase [Spirosomataceae bacterium]